MTYVARSLHAGIHAFRDALSCKQRASPFMVAGIVGPCEVGLKIRRVLLDRAFFNGAVMAFWPEEKLSFVMPAVLRGRAPTRGGGMVPPPKSARWIVREIVALFHDGSTPLAIRPPSTQLEAADIRMMASRDPPPISLGGYSSAYTRVLSSLVTGDCMSSVKSWNRVRRSPGRTAWTRMRNCVSDFGGSRERPSNNTRWPATS